MAHASHYYCVPICKEHAFCAIREDYGGFTFPRQLQHASTAFRGLRERVKERGKGKSLL